MKDSKQKDACNIYFEDIVPQSMLITLKFDVMLRYVEWVPPIYITEKIKLNIRLDTKQTLNLLLGSGWRPHSKSFHSLL